MSFNNTFQKNFDQANDEKYMTAIVVCLGPENIGEPFKKYRNIPKATTGKNSFLLFAGKFPGISYINFYEKKKLSGESRGRFIERINFT